MPRRRFQRENNRNKGLGVGVHSEPGVLSPDAETIDSQVQSLSADQLLDRYHEWVGQRLDGRIHFRESFELDRIEAAPQRGEPRRAWPLENSPG